MTNEEKLRAIIREVLQEELDEMTTTGDVAGYNIPMAFQGNNPKNKARKKGIATQLGMQLTPRGQQDMNRPADKLDEGKIRYHEYKKDESATPTQKIAKAISEVNRNLQEMERVIRMNTRLQKESGIASEALYNRTRQGLLKLEARLLHLAGKVREIRGK
jgi:hypothetical protein